MFNNAVLRQVSCAVRSSRPSTVSLSRQSIAPALTHRGFHATQLRRKDAEKIVEEGEHGRHVGTHARTDDTFQFEHPAEKDYPSSKVVQGRGGYHFKRTLASFSLEGNVGLVTGGARGLGLVMSQALIVSGADIAIVDLNGTFSWA